MVKLSRIDIGEDDLNKFFSIIELSILDVLWECGEKTASELADETGLAQATIAGTLDRLLMSGFVDRRIESTTGRIRCLYSASATREETVIAITARILNSLVDSFEDIDVEEFRRSYE